MRVAAAAGAEAIAKCRGTSVVKERRAHADADERGDLQRSAGADVDGLVVGELGAAVASNAC